METPLDSVEQPVHTMELNEDKVKIATLEVEIERLTTQMDALELQSLAIEGASFYSKTRLKHAPIEQRTLIFNAVAHGIVMGWRKKESMMGIPSEENWVDNIKDSLIRLGLHKND